MSGEVIIKAGSYCPVCKGCAISDCHHSASEFASRHSGSTRASGWEDAKGEALDAAFKAGWAACLLDPPAPEGRAPSLEEAAYAYVTFALVKPLPSPPEPKP